MESASSSSDSTADVARRLFRGAILLQYPVTTAATAVAYLHRSCAVLPQLLEEKQPDIFATALLFLAGKVTENIRKIRDVLNVILVLLNKNPSSMTVSQYLAKKQSVIEEEHFLLRLLGFVLQVNLPHGYLLNIARSLNASKATVRISWSLLNDSTLDKRFISTEPIVLACACLVIGFRLTSQLPVSSTDHGTVVNIGDGGRHNQLETSRKRSNDHAGAHIPEGWYRRFRVRDDDIWEAVFWVSSIPIR